MSEFSLRKDFNLVLWKETLQVNGIRCIVAVGPIMVFSLVFSLFHPGSDFQHMRFSEIIVAIGSMVLSLALAPVGVILVGLFLQFLVNMRVPFAGWVNICFALPMILFADPILYFVHKKKPELIPVEDYHLFNFATVIFALKTP